MEFKLDFIRAHTNKPVFDINIFVWLFQRFKSKCLNGLSNMSVHDKQLDLKLLSSVIFISVYFGEVFLCIKEF